MNTASGLSNFFAAQTAKANDPARRPRAAQIGKTMSTDFAKARTKRRRRDWLTSAALATAASKLAQRGRWRALALLHLAAATGLSARALVRIDIDQLRFDGETATLAFSGREWQLTATATAALRRYVGGRKSGALFELGGRRLSERAARYELESARVLAGSAGGGGLRELLAAESASDRAH